MKSLVHEKSKYSEWKGKTEVVLFNTLFAINYIYKISKHRKIALFRNINDLYSLLADKLS